MSGQHNGLRREFDLHLWTCNLEISRDHLLIGRNPCAKFGIDQVKRSKDIERTTQWAEKRGLTLTVEHVSWKSIRIIYALRTTPASSDQVKGSKDIERTTLGLQTNRPTDRHILTDRQLQNNFPFFLSGRMNQLRIWIFSGRQEIPLSLKANIFFF